LVLRPRRSTRIHRIGQKPELHPGSRQILEVYPGYTLDCYPSKILELYIPKTPEVYKSYNTTTGFEQPMNTTYAIKPEHLDHWAMAMAAVADSGLKVE